MWRLAEPFIAKAAERSGEVIGHWLGLLATDRMQLWVGWNGEACEAAALTELAKRRNGLACQIVAFGSSDMGRWLGFLEEIERWAKAQGCVSMNIQHGRKGWARMLPDFTVTGISLERKI